MFVDEGCRLADNTTPIIAIIRQWHIQSRKEEKFSPKDLYANGNVVKNSLKNIETY